MTLVLLRVRTLISPDLGTVMNAMECIYRQYLLWKVPKEIVADNVQAALEKLLHFPITGKMVLIPQRRTEYMRSNLLTRP